MEGAAEFRSGFVTLLGRPNTGKSTLVNALVGRHVAAVTPHPQTTRTHLLGVLNLAGAAGHPPGQIVLVDTPGVHRGRGHLSRAMLRSVRAGLEGRDLSLFLADVTRRFGAEDQLALDMLRAPGAGPGAAQPPAFLLLNKVDLLPRGDAVLPIIDEYRHRFAFAEVIPLSALRGQNLPVLIRQMLAYLPPGPAYFAPDQVTDQPEQFLIGEIIREQAMLLTREEVPHTLAVRLEGDVWRGPQRGFPATAAAATGRNAARPANARPGLGARKPQAMAAPRRERPAGSVRLIQAAIVCERPGQKAILVGHGGGMIRKIGIAARRELEAALGERIFLELHVQVREDWRENPRLVAALNFRHEGPSG